MRSPSLLFCSVFIIFTAPFCFAQGENATDKTPPGKSREALIGTWKLVSIEELSANDKVTYPMGRNVAGYLMYDAAGRMSQQVMSSDRPAISLRTATRQELNEYIFNGFDAYSGKYSINEEDGTISYYVECSIFPTVVGTELKRKFELTGDQLIIKSSFTDKDDGKPRSRVMTWKRAK